MKRRASKGKILRVKLGVNPNSSSIGTDLTVFLFSATAVTIIVNLLDVGIRLWLRQRRKNAGAAS